MELGKKIKISQKIIDKCREFAKARIDKSANLYAYRGEARIEKMIEDIIFGTVGEWGAYKYLRKCGVHTSKPDMEIYEKQRKSFSADLVNDSFGINFHIKSQSTESKSRYGSSWLLQRRDKIVSNPSELDYFIFCTVDLPYVTVEGIVRCSDVEYGECKVPKYRNTKVALYFDNILQKNIDIFPFIKCTSCGIVKPKSEFYKRKDTSFGFNKICKNCKNKYNKK